MGEARSGYHHGDLRAALIRTGLQLAREDGAAAVGVREATRRAGVSARAAYRHFADRDALVQAVAQQALDRMSQEIIAGQQGVTDGAGLLRAVGEGYVRFALAEPGWFDVAFFAMGRFVMAAPTPDDPQPDQDPQISAHPEAVSPYELLHRALATAVAEGRLDPDRVPGAALVCWSGVHGFATLAARGPLRALPRELALAQGRRLVADLVAAVLTGAGAEGD